MYCDVYELRHLGQRLTPDEIRETKATGWLYFGRYGDMSPPELHAYLHKSEHSPMGVGELLPRLQFATMKTIKGGLMLVGQNITNSPRAIYRQAWWVVPLGPHYVPEQTT